MADESTTQNYHVTAKRNGMVVIDTIILVNKLRVVMKMLNSEMLETVATPTNEQLATQQIVGRSPGSV